MDTKKRTQILYDDPNSVFKAGKKIYLHELKGATLKSGKQFPNDIDADLEGADLMESLIRDLSTLQHTLEMYYLVLFEGNMVGRELFASFDAGVREANKVIGYINPILKKLMKIKPDTFNEDDAYMLLGFYTDIMEKLQEIAQHGQGVNLGPANAFFRGIRFSTYFVKIGKMLENLKVFIQWIGGDNIVLPNPNPQQNVPSLFGPPPEPEPPEYIPPPPPGPPDGYDPDVDDMEGAGRFKVLSKRIRKQQVKPFKRFL